MQRLGQAGVMTDFVQQDIDEKVAETAAGWFVRLQSLDARAEDWLAFEIWLATDPAHLAAYEKIEALSAEIDANAGVLAARLATGPALVGANLDRRPLPRRPAARVTRRVWLVTGGGAIAASLALGVALFTQQGPIAPESVYRTAAGESRTLKLADGTHIRLNAGSTLRVRLEREARRVDMAEAEAAFDVTHDPKRPFLITTGDTQVRVVGTEFNIRRRDAQTELTVRRGVVEVRPGSPEARPIRVAAGHQFVHHDGAPQASLSEVNASDAFAWTEGQLVYRDRPLAEVAADLSRRFGRSISTADPQTGAIRFTGVLVTDSEPAVIRRLESFAPVKAEITPAGVILHGR